MTKGDAIEELQSMLMMCHNYAGSLRMDTKDPREREAYQAVIRSAKDANNKLQRFLREGDPVSLSKELPFHTKALLKWNSLTERPSA